MKDENFKTFLVDASFVLSYLLPDEEKDFSKPFFMDFKEGKITFISSPILEMEVINGIKSAVKSKRIHKKFALSLLKKFLAMTIELLKINLTEIFELALEENLSVYDASYLWLSKDKGVPLLTLDKFMQKIN